MYKIWSAARLVPTALAFLAFAAVPPALSLAAGKPAGGGVPNPGNVQVSPQQSTATLLWTAPTGSVGGYKVAYSVYPETPALLAAVNVGNVTSYCIFGLAPATSYNFKIWSWTKDKKGKESTSSGVQVNCTISPVFYNLRWLDTLGHSNGETDQMNNSGKLVGCVFDRDSDGERTNKRAFYFDGANSHDLNDADFMGSALASNWIADYATSINNSGQIAGRLKATNSESYRGFVYDLSTGTTIVLPPPQSGGNQRSVIINSSGDVVAGEEAVDGTYYITMYHPDPDGGNNGGEYVPGMSWQMPTYPVAFNASGQILLHNGMRFTPSVGWQDFKLTLGVQAVYDMNDQGTFVGTRTVGSTQFPFRFQDPDLVQDFAQNGYAYAVNLQGDVCLTFGSRGYVSYSDRSGLWALDHAVPGDIGWKEADLTWLWDNADRSPTAGAICGNAHFWSEDGSTTQQIRPFLLTPQ